MFGNSQNTILSCIYQSNISIKWLREILQQLVAINYSKCAMKIALVAWLGHRAGIKCSLAPFFQSLYCIVLKKNSVAYLQLSTTLCG